MLFNSTIFILVFLPLTVTAYYLLAASRTWRLCALGAASLVFYGFWDVRFLPLLAGSVVVNWLIAALYVRRRLLFLPLIGVAANLALLALFKYADFLTESAAAMLGQSHDGFGIILPIGISFFTFQQISYLVDLKRGQAKLYPVLDYFVFVTFFPQLIAGPIVRHHEIIDQFSLPPRRPAVWETLSRGSLLFIAGLFKKVVLADQLALIADPMFGAAAAGNALSFSEAWFGDLAFTLQIYFDFSGYSDMAIGLGLMFGFRLPVNFNAPYRATSIRAFWRRWHITLSRFLRDYVYIPLGGNRSGRRRQAINVVLTMLLGGLWHGAAWTFVVWGGLHGVALAVAGRWQRSGRALAPAWGWALTMLFLTFTWVLFRAEDFATAASVMASMVGLNGFGTAVVEEIWLIPAGLALVLLAPTSQSAVFARFRPSRWLAAGMATALVFIVIMIGSSPHNEFIYFQF